MARFARRRFSRRRGFGSTLFAFVAGMGAMYFFDTQSGGRRRALVRDQVSHARHLGREAMRDVERDFDNRSRGWAARLTSLLRGGGPVDDEVLVERVHARLGHVGSHPSAVEVKSKGGGCIELKGPVLARDRLRVLATVASIPGVHTVDDDLEVHETADVPALQGESRRAPFFVRHWNPTTRFFVGATGAMLTARGLFGRGFARLPRLTAGLALLGASVALNARSSSRSDRVAPRAQPSTEGQALERASVL